MMNLNPGSVDSSLSIIEAYDKDKGFKQALKDLKKAMEDSKISAEEVAEHEKRMKSATTKAQRKETSSLNALRKLEERKEVVELSEKELENARKAFNSNMLAKQNQVFDREKELKAEDARLKALDGQLKQLQSDLTQKSAKLAEDQAAFQAYRDKIKSALAA